jgi:hypothetical protein
MNSLKSYPKIHIVFSAATIAVSTSLLMTTASAAPEAEAKVSTPIASASKGADVKNLAAKEVKPDGKKLNAKEKQLMTPKRGLAETGGTPPKPGPIPPKTELKTVETLKAPLAPSANSKKGQTTNSAGDVKAGIDKPMPSTPAKQ